MVFMTGNKIGVRIRIKGAISIKVPNTSSMMLTHNKITQGSLLKAVKTAVIFSGIIIKVMM